MAADSAALDVPMNVAAAWPPPILLAPAAGVASAVDGGAAAEALVLSSPPAWLVTATAVGVLGACAARVCETEAAGVDVGRVVTKLEVDLTSTQLRS